ncbi:glycosyl transferase family protein [Stanieria cyanosphaera PCC 7437]|uniref:Glycosyl transferase family protein n=1 Tax=Stanieria cyanosphaera (strain ATCC 29371 / PCC 7437) TaxID=111780 RepID=K9XWV3_STAC7|nr:glycosyl transferase [Stanieria cyanosphaera]AFZ36142.1 glycosyl transferase family protein [Stanieria cyanosphaera PCC 7437]
MVNTSFSNPKQLAKYLNLGKIVYSFYYAPKSFLQKCLRIGLINMAIDHIEKLRMEQAAYHLPTIPTYSSPSTPLEIYFLSGKKFWYQTCFCAYSMVQQSKLNIRPVVYDDGTLKPKYIKEIKRIFPNAKIVLVKEIEAYLEKHLPINKFPYLRERRLNYPNLRKLTDIHIGSRGWKLVLDSDMLFFRSPTLLLNWLQSPHQPCYMVDTETSYGYSEILMRSLAGTEIPERLNVGICGLKSDDIDWEQLEFWCRTTVEKEGRHYYQEQALIAMLLANQNCLVAPEEDYIVMPNQEEGINPKAVLHHYVADSKPWYFRYGWKLMFI